MEGGRTCDTPQNIFAVRPQHHVEVRLLSKISYGELFVISITK